MKVTDEIQQRMDSVDKRLTRSNTKIISKKDIDEALLDDGDSDGDEGTEITPDHSPDDPKPVTPKKKSKAIGVTKSGGIKMPTAYNVSKVTPGSDRRQRKTPASHRAKQTPKGTTSKKTPASRGSKPAKLVAQRSSLRKAKSVVSDWVSVKMPRSTLEEHFKRDE